MRKAFLSIIISSLIILPLTNVLAVGTNYRYTGKPFDSNTNLYYYGQRYYDPITGRFTQPDPVVNNLANPQKFKQSTGQDLQKFLEDPQKLNEYNYTLNNPIKYTDPTGEQAVELIQQAGPVITAVDAAIVTSAAVVGAALVPVVKEFLEKVKDLTKTVVEATKQKWAKGKIESYTRTIEVHFGKLGNSDPNDPNWKKWMNEIKDKIKLQWEKVKYLKGETREKVIEQIKQTEERLKQFEAMAKEKSKKEGN